MNYDRRIACLASQNKTASDKPTNSVDTRVDFARNPWRILGACAFPVLMVASGLLYSASSASAEYKSEFIPFPHATFNFNDKDVPSIEQHDSDIAVDFFYTAEIGPVRVLAEFFANADEREMERLAVGWTPSEDTRIWLGRYHTALGQWNRKYHHGVYLQTTIYRPSIIEFEDDGGVIPAHATGLTLGSMSNSFSYTTHYSLDVGLGPELVPGSLEALDILKPGVGEHSLSLTLAVSRHGVDRPADDNGLFVGFVRIPSSIPGIEQVEQHIVGGYTNYTLNRLHLTGSLIWVDVSVDLTGSQKNSSFGYGYVQPEYLLSNQWTLYARAEGTARAGDNLYLQQIPAYIRQRGLIGARYQFSKAQALKFEIASLEQYETRFNQAVVQWSAAIP